MDIKSLSSKQVCWAPKLSQYYFQIDYCQEKTNKATDALLYYSQQNAREKKTFQAKNIKILHCLPFLLTKVFGFLISYFFSFYQIFICKTIV